MFSMAQHESRSCSGLSISLCPIVTQVLVFYSNRKHEITREDIYDADVVLTTFPVLELAYRKVVDVHKV